MRDPKYGENTALLLTVYSVKEAKKNRISLHLSVKNISIVQRKHRYTETEWSGDGDSRIEILRKKDVQGEGDITTERYILARREIKSLCP